MSITVELSNLRIKIKKLALEVERNGVGITAGNVDERARMKTQLHYMRRYAEILQARIDAVHPFSDKARSRVIIG